MFNFLKRNIPFSTYSLKKKQLYQSLILSILLYGSCVLSPSNSCMRKLENFQQKVLKWICSNTDYVSALLQLDMLPLCFQMIKNDVVLLWKLHNNHIDVDHPLSVTNQESRFSPHGFFNIPRNKKVSSDANFFVRATRAANELLRLQIVNFMMPLPTFKSELNSYGLEPRILTFPKLVYTL